MDIAINYEGEKVIAKDKHGNSIFFHLTGKYLKVLFAEYEGIIYDKTELGWKRTKKGAVSTKFYNWYSEMDRLIYIEHYKGK